MPMRPGAQRSPANKKAAELRKKRAAKMKQRKSAHSTKVKRKNSY